MKFKSKIFNGILYLTSLLLSCSFTNEIFAKSDVYTFACPEPQEIFVHGTTWSGEFIFTKNGIRQQMPKVSNKGNPNENPKKLIRVDLYPEQEPNSLIDCFYNTETQKGHLDTEPYALPEHCHFKDKPFGPPSQCEGSIEACTVVCDAISN